MSDMQTERNFESLPNEILLECFAYFHAVELFYSFNRLNQRFNQLIRTLHWHLDFQHVHRSIYDQICQHILDNPDRQQRIHSLRLSNKNTPGQIRDFLSKFSLDQFSRLRSLTFVDLEDNNMELLRETLPKLSQTTTLRLLDSPIDEYKIRFFIPLDHLRIFSIDAKLTFVFKMIPIRSLTLSFMSLNEICRCFPHTPCLRYLKISCIRKEVLNAEYHQSARPAYLKHLILPDFRPYFNDLTAFLQKMSHLQRLKICSCSDIFTVSAHYWEKFIRSSLPHLKDFRFKCGLKLVPKIETFFRAFERFQTDFWTKEHQWFVEGLYRDRFCAIYTVPYDTEFSPIPLESKRFPNPFFDHSQAFKHVYELKVSDTELFRHGDYHFPNVTSLIIADSFPMANDEDERHLIDSLNSLVNLSNLKHLEIPLNCRTERLSVLFQILELTPQLSSLSTKRCFFELLAAQPESSRYLTEKIRRLNLEEYCSHESHQSCRMNILYQSVPNLEQLTMSMTNIDDMFFLLNHFSKLSCFTVNFTSKEYLQALELFKKQALEQNAIVDERTGTFRAAVFITIAVWTNREKI